MSFGFTTSNLRFISQKAAKSSTKLLSRTLSLKPGYPILPEISSPTISVDSNLLTQIHQDGFSNSPRVLTQIISSCAKAASLFMGIQIHSSIIKRGFSSNVFICSALVDMYGKCNVILSAQQVFDEMPERNVVTWNTLISGYLHIERPKTALGLFLDMLELGIAITQFTLSAVLVGCSMLKTEWLGAQVQCLSLKYGFYFNVVVGTGLIDMYAKCANEGNSRRVFDEMHDRTIITWTSMVACYSQNQKPEEALILFKEMQCLGLKSNYVTYNNLLSSFSTPDYLDHCKQVHCLIIHEGFESDAFVAVSLLTVYSECGSSLQDFRSIFSGIKIWDQISWNAAIAGFSYLGSENEALKCLLQMREAGIIMDSFTFASTLKAIGNISALEEGKHVHALVFKSGHASNLCVQNGLVSMYARCGKIIESKRVFSSMDKHDLISWNSLLSGCAYHGYGTEAIEVFEQMKKMGVQPDNTTFLSVLSACSHVGLLEKGLEYFDLMRNYNLPEPPKIEHYACVIDLYGRAGYLHEAEAFINSMPIKPGPSVYKALLSACQVHGNKEIAASAADKLVELCPDDPATYILLSNVFADRGSWDDAAGIRKIMRASGVRKDPGYSWV